MNPGDPGSFDFSSLLAQAQRLQQDLVKAQEAARQRTVEASAGGGMVTAVVSGALEVVSLKIDPQVVDPKDVGMLEDLVRAAINQAVQRAQEMVQAEVGKLAGGIQGLPQGLF